MDKILNLTQACQLMGVSYSKGQKLAKSGALPFRKLGGTWMIPQSTLFRELGLEPAREKRDEN